MQVFNIGSGKNVDTIKAIATLPPATSEALQTVMDITNDGIWDWDGVTGAVYRNKAWYQMLGYLPDSLDNTVLTWESLIHPDDYERVMKRFDDCINKRTNVYSAEYRIKTQSGQYIWIRDTGMVVEWQANGRVARMIGAHTNINDKKMLIDQLAKQNLSLEAVVESRTKELIRVNSELERRIREVERLAETDSLTGVSNRYRLEKTLALEVERAQRFHQPLSVMAIDLDDFKDVNDTFGHASGDMVLIALANLIQSNVREIDLVSRWGGDEFMIVLPNTNLSAAKITAEKLLRLTRNIPLDKNIQTSISIGLAELQPQESAMRLSIRADSALYKSKGAGKNKISIANP